MSFRPELLNPTSRPRFKEALPDLNPGADDPSKPPPGNFPLVPFRGDGLREMPSLSAPWVRALPLTGLISKKLGLVGCLEATKPSKTLPGKICVEPV